MALTKKQSRKANAEAEGSRRMKHFARAAENMKRERPHRGRDFAGWIGNGSQFSSIEARSLSSSLFRSCVSQAALLRFL